MGVFGSLAPQTLTIENMVPTLRSTWNCADIISTSYLANSTRQISVFYQSFRFYLFYTSSHSWITLKLHTFIRITIRKLLLSRHFSFSTNVDFETIFYVHFQESCEYAIWLFARIPCSPIPICFKLCIRAYFWPIDTMVK